MQTAFAKYEGAGNDFILIDARTNNFTPESKLIARLCDRHFGIGADGLMLLQCNKVGLYTMLYYNADGSQGEMCGNGGRCFTLFAHHLGLPTTPLTFSSLDGQHTAQLIHTQDDAGQIALGMIDVEHILCGAGYWSLNTGVPHYVEFVQDLAAVDVCGRGRAIRGDLQRFPQGTNVNFVQVQSQGQISVRTYERGVEAETLACGTGATAAAIVTNYALQQGTTTYRVATPGGMLEVAFDRPSRADKYLHISLSGAARKVFTGTFNTQNF